ncbi:hypothetical protein D1872_328990 [compost metagenome]
MLPDHRQQRQAKAEEQHLQQQRRAAHDINVRVRQPGQRFEAAAHDQRYAEAERHGQYDRDQEHDDRCLRPIQHRF